MRFREFKPMLTEAARGFYGRQPGDQYVHDDGSVLIFVDITSYPTEEGVWTYEDPDVRDAAIAAIEAGIQNDIEWVNTPNKGNLAFGITELDDQDGNRVYWGRYFRALKGDMAGTWASKQIPQGWKSASSGAVKMQAGFDPQTLIATEKEFQNVVEVFKTVQTNSPDEFKDVFVTALSTLSKGSTDVTFPEMWDKQTALRDYFGEIMQPLALMGGAIMGPAEEARADLADGADWSECAVTWPMAGNAALCDSFVIAPNGQRIGISSKGGTGANASAKNIHDAYLKAEAAGNTELVKSAAYTIKILDTIVNNSATSGPIALGRLLKITGLTLKLQQEIDNYIAEGKKDFGGVSPIAKKLLTFTAFKTDKPTFNTGYALLSVVAKIVASKINASGKFSAGALNLLKQSSIIQIYTTMKKSKNNAVLASFKSVYPPNFEGNVILDAGKNYSGTAAAGKLAFMFGDDAKLNRMSQPPKPKPEPKPPKKITAADPSGNKKAGKKPAGRAKRNT